jgi:diguanylate cyclase (GGDEF)-like protein
MHPRHSIQSTHMLERLPERRASNPQPPDRRVAPVIEADRNGLPYAGAIALTFISSWILTYFCGGTHVVTPDWFLVPIVVCAFRFGRVQTLAVSVAAGLLAGPVMPDHFDHGVAIAQGPSDWISRFVAFVVIGQITAFLFFQLRRRYASDHASLYDQLTGLANRILFGDRLQHGLARLERSKGVLSVLVFDLDDFETVNIKYDHLVGDEVLVAVSARLREAVRASDTLARLSSDEFAMLVEGTDLAAGITTAERVVESLQAPFRIDGDKLIAVRLSAGVSTTTDARTSADEMVREARFAVRTSKELGKNRYSVA